MSYKQIYTCDHCGTESNGAIYASIWGEGNATAPYTHTRLDGCTHEHLSFAVAKILGIGVGGKATELLATKDAHIAELTAEHMRAQSSADALTERIRAMEQDLAQKKDRIAELEALPDAAEALQMVLEAYRGYTGNIEGPGARELTDTMREVERRLVSLTGPKKPTKPAVELPDKELVLDWMRMARNQVEEHARAKQKAIWQNQVDEAAAEYIVDRLKELLP